MVENRVRIIIAIIVSVFLIEKEAPSKELSISIQFLLIQMYSLVFVNLEALV